MNQPHWFQDSAFILIPAVRAKHDAQVKISANRSVSTLEELRLAGRNVQHLTRAAIDVYWRNPNLCDHIEECALLGNVRGMYSGIKEALGPVPKKSAPLKTTTGEELTDLEAQLNGWVQHYETLYADERHAY